MVTYQIQDNEEEFDVWKRMLDGFVETAKKQKMSFSVQKTVERDMTRTSIRVTYTYSFSEQPA